MAAAGRISLKVRERAAGGEGGPGGERVEGVCGMCPGWMDGGRGSSLYRLTVKEDYRGRGDPELGEGKDSTWMCYQ